MTKTTKERLTSRKFLVSLWAIILLTTLSIWSMATSYDPSWMGTLFPFLALIIGTWIGITGLIEKNKLSKEKKETDE